MIALVVVEIVTLGLIVSARTCKNKSQTNANKYQTMFFSHKTTAGVDELNRVEVC